MSNEERQQQQHYFKKIDQYGFRITFMQGVTILALAFSCLSWYIGKDEKTTIDGAALSVKIDNLSKDIRIGKTRDSLSAVQYRFTDSINMAKKFEALKESINADLNRKFFSQSVKINDLEKRVNYKFVQEVKRNGPSGPVVLKPANN